MPNDGGPAIVGKHVKISVGSYNSGFYAELFPSRYKTDKLSLRIQRIGIKILARRDIELVLLIAGKKRSREADGSNIIRIGFPAGGRALYAALLVCERVKRPVGTKHPAVENRKPNLRLLVESRLEKIKRGFPLLLQLVIGRRLSEGGRTGEQREYWPN